MQNEILEKGQSIRKSSYPVLPLIVGRWSPRAMSGQPISDQELMAVFEAARWAPSASNGQPWRFIYAKRDTASWDTLFHFLVEGNQAWAKNAAVLVVMISRKNFEYKEKPNKTHSFCTGAAWENMALQAVSQGLAIHGMAGFDYEKARTDLGIPDLFHIEAMCAIGKPGKIEDLSEKNQGRETPSDRKPLSEIIMEGKFQG